MFRNEGELVRVLQDLPVIRNDKVSVVPGPCEPYRVFGAELDRQVIAGVDKVVLRDFDEP